MSTSNDGHAGLGESSRSAQAQTHAGGAATGNGNANGKGKAKANGNGNGCDTPSPAIDFTAGVIAGAAGLVVGQPFDVVKVRYQTPQFAGRYSSTFGALGAIVREEGARGLFKGVMSPMAGIAFINGVVFTSYSFFMRMQISPDSTEEPTLGQIFLAGAGSGFMSSLLTCPTELIKIRQQSAPPHLNPSVLSVMKSIIRTDGARGLFRGFSATATRDLAYGPYFCTYEALCRFFKWLKPPSSNGNGRRHEGHTLIDEAEEELARLTWPELMAAGGIAGVTAWLATFPLDVFKTRMQSHAWPSGSGPSQRETNINHQASGAVVAKAPRRISPALPSPTLRAVAVEAVKKEGWKVMFAGLGPTLIRAVPTNMVIFLTFEACVASLS